MSLACVVHSKVFAYFPVDHRSDPFYIVTELIYDILLLSIIVFFLCIYGLYPFLPRIRTPLNFGPSVMLSGWEIYYNWE